MTHGTTPPARPGGVVVCADVGSTFTKVAAVDDSATLLATAQRPTTADVLVGLDDAIAALGLGPIPDAQVLACSSAGGGLRLAVVGHERLVSAEAGRRAALSAGARVVAVSAGALEPGSVDALVGAAPDVVLLAGGTDGGDAEVLLHNAAALGRALPPVPVVVAGNAGAAQAAAGLLASPGRAVITVANVLPRIGHLVPGPARRAIREVFVGHVIGGKGLSQQRRFARLVRCATPDAVLAGVEVVAALTGDVMAVDVGGATTDVYSVLQPDDHAHDGVVETLWHGRTVEGDLGMRSSAPDVLAAAAAERMAVPPGLAAAATRRHDDVALLPATGAERAEDLELASLAAVLAVRRHARPGPDEVRDLSRVRLLIGSGGVLRHADPGDAARLLDGVLTDYAGGWRLPGRAAAQVDRRYLLAPIGLLTLAGRTDAAQHLAGALVAEGGPER